MALHEEVGTEFKAIGSEGYQHAMEGIAASAERAGHAAHGLLDRITPLGLALGALGAGFSGEKILAVNEQFEAISTRMAATLSSLRVTPDFVSGLSVADTVIKSINTSAATLPGKAEDYIHVFTQGLPMVSAALGGTLAHATKFTNQYVAVLSSMQIPVEEQAMTLDAALASGEGALRRQSMAARLLVNQMAQLPGHVGLTVAGFNKLTQAQRGALLEQATFSTSNKAMLEYASTKWPAVIGAVKTTGHLLLRLSTAPLFEGMTHSLHTFNSAFMDSDGHLTKFGQTIVRIGSSINTHISNVVEHMADKFEELSTHAESVLGRLRDSPVVKVLDSLFARIASVGHVVAGALGPSAVGMGGGTPTGVGMHQVSAAAIVLATALAGPIGALATFAIGLDGMYTIATALAPVMTDLFGLIAQLVVALVPLVQWVLQLAVQLGQVLVPVVVTVVNAISAFISTLRETVTAFLWVLDGLAAAFTAFSPAFQALLVQVWDNVAGIFAENVERAALTLGLSVLAAAVLSLVNWLNKAGFHAEHAAQRGFGPAPNTAGTASAAIASLMAKMKEQNEHANTDLAKMMLHGGKGTPAERGGAKMTQDFRNSRFSIQQSFAENFDPDRVAVAFARDVGKIGQQRLQSGFEPLFGVRG